MKLKKEAKQKIGLKMDELISMLVKYFPNFLLLAERISFEFSNNKAMNQSCFYLVLATTKEIPFFGYSRKSKGKLLFVRQRKIKRKLNKQILKNYSLIL